MVWRSMNQGSGGGGNYAAWSAPNYSALGSSNYAAYAGPNYAAYSSPNYGAQGSANYGAQGSGNYGAQGSGNYGAQASGNYGGQPVLIGMAGPPVAAAPVRTGTGAGSASGTGFIGGYGPVARFEYATPAGLAPVPWVLDFASGDGWPPFPLRQTLDPHAFDPPLQWQPDDWDPGLRFWTLPFDPHLTEWLQDLNLAAPGVTAAREFAGAAEQWLAAPDRVFEAGQPARKSALHAAFEHDAPFLHWLPRSPAEYAAARIAIQGELDELSDLMRDDRARYLDELAVQSGTAIPYFVHLMGFDPASKPWTMELMSCATAIGNLVKMQYKSHYRRVRPSLLCPGLVPPWGPPRHPAFPSGHSTVSHLIALFLLAVPGIAQRFGVFAPGQGVGKAPTPAELIDSDTGTATNASTYGHNQRSALLWMAWRIAKGRERLALHYPSDSAAGRRLAVLVWKACCLPAGDGPRSRQISVPALQTVLRRAEAEWPVWDVRTDGGTAGGNGSTAAANGGTAAGNGSTTQAGTEAPATPHQGATAA